MAEEPDQADREELGPVGLCDLVRHVAQRGGDLDLFYRLRLEDEAAAP